ncbi:unnamed protein product [Rhizophagus irregularis]|nr:unnamed protein product [Rhizophagus irregularis]
MITNSKSDRKFEKLRDFLPTLNPKRYTEIMLGCIVLGEKNAFPVDFDTDLNIISTACRIMEDIMKLDENETIYSDPKNFLSLPYPYLGEKLPIDRFDIDHDGSFIFMGRTKFEQVLEDINKLQPRSYMKLFIYGTVGYGKSHILTAIAYFLF